MRIVVIGLGYLGLTAAVGLAGTGHRVVGVERDADRVGHLRANRAPFFEPGLDEALTAAVAAGRLFFAADLGEVAGQVDVAVVAVGSPGLPDGGADLTQLERALDRVSAMDCLVVVKSSVPPGTSDAWAAGTFATLAPRYVYVPEFLSQGTAMHDWYHPDRIVLGGWNDDAVSVARTMFTAETTYLLTTPVEAETIKYTSNAFLAMRISFANEIARLCDAFGADVAQVLYGAGLDERIGPQFWRPGLGYGDSCLGKDVSALIHRAATHGVAMPILESVQATNRAQHLRPLAVLREERSRLPWPPTVAVLGLAYEPHSDDIRAAPSLSLVPQLCMVTMEITVWDPMLARSVVAGLFPFARIADSPAEAVRDADVVVILTEYPAVVSAQWLDLIQGSGRPVLVIDGKNCLPDKLIADTTTYRGIGRRA
jgi:UDPglucose 6-dehydrogenase